MYFENKIEKIDLSITNEKDKKNKINNTKCGKKIKNYLNAKKRKINCRINKENISDFQKLVFGEVKKIDYGKTKTYGRISKKIDSSPIAVGRVLGLNPYPLIFPCHRVVKKESLGGYRFGVEIKKKLINFEKFHL